MITLVSSSLTECLHAAFAAEHAAEGLQIEHVAFIRAENQADVSHHQKCGQAEERAGALRHGGVRQNQRSEISAQDARGSSRWRRRSGGAGWRGATAVQKE